jgi:hypothetical protein
MFILVQPVRTRFHFDLIPHTLRPWGRTLSSFRAWLLAIVVLTRRLARLATHWVAHTLLSFAAIDAQLLYAAPSQWVCTISGYRRYACALVWQLPGYMVLYLQRGGQQEAARESSLDAGFVALSEPDHVATEVVDLMIQRISSAPFGPGPFASASAVQPGSPRESLGPGSSSTGSFTPAP